MDTDNRIVSTGFNGFPRGVLDLPERYANREMKHKIVLHAEDNALLFAHRSVLGCTVYVSPLHPCVRCAVKLIQAGIAKVVYRAPRGLLADRYAEDLALSTRLYEEAGVTLEEVWTTET